MGVFAATASRLGCSGGAVAGPTRQRGACWRGARPAARTSRAAVAATAVVAGLDRRFVSCAAGGVCVALVCGGAVSYSLGLHGAYAARRRFDFGEQIHLRLTAAGLEP